MKTILLVEDSEYTAKAIKLVLEFGGYTVIHLTDGTAVMDTIIEHDIDLIILDLMLPGISGKELFDIIKSNEKGKKIKIMILTARMDIVNWDIDLQSCDKIMKKPFDNHELLEEIGKLI